MICGRESGWRVTPCFFQAFSSAFLIKTISWYLSSSLIYLGFTLNGEYLTCQAGTEVAFRDVEIGDGKFNL